MGSLATLTTEPAEQAAREAIGPVLVLRFNEKFTDVNVSGYPVKALNAGIATVEQTGLWRFESVTVEKDNRTLGDRMAFYAVFRRVTATVPANPVPAV